MLKTGALISTALLSLGLAAAAMAADVPKAADAPKAAAASPAAAVDAPKPTKHHGNKHHHKAPADAAAGDKK